MAEGKGRQATFAAKRFGMGQKMENAAGFPPPTALPPETGDPRPFRRGACKYTLLLMFP